MKGVLLQSIYRVNGINNVFVPVNFSGQSVLALEEAVLIQKKTPQSLRIFCHYIYELPLGFEKSGKTEEEFAKIIDKNSMKKFIKLKHKIGIETAEFNFTHELLKDGNIAKEIVAKAKTFDTDLIIMGAQTKTLTAQLFLGNTTKKMIIHDGDIPLLIIKDKKTTFDFWDFFSKM